MNLKKMEDGTYSTELSTGRYARVYKESLGGTRTQWVLEELDASGTLLAVPRKDKTLKAIKQKLGVSA